MQHTPVTSSFIESVAHDGDTLQVKFASGKIVTFAGVPAEEHAKLMGAESIGRHFGQHIRGKYDVVHDPEETVF